MWCYVAIMKQRRQPTNAQRIPSQDEAAVGEKFQEESMEQQQVSERDSCGKVFKSDEMLEQELEYLSEGIDRAGNEYKLYLGRISRNPVVKNIKTGLCYVLPWPDILKLAEAAGLNH